MTLDKRIADLAEEAMGNGDEPPSDAAIAGVRRITERMPFPPAVFPSGDYGGLRVVYQDRATKRRVDFDVDRDGDFSIGYGISNGKVQHFESEEECASWFINGRNPATP